MLKNSHLGFPGSPGSSTVVVTCEDVALDSSHPQTVYVGFEASQGGSIPPVYNVAPDVPHFWGAICAPTSDGFRRGVDAGRNMQEFQYLLA
jgi:hypothetical protein